MDVKRCIITRRSVRSFTNQSVDVKDIEQIIETARFAPSWKNTQTARYTLVMEETLKQKIADDCMMDFTFNQGIVNYAPAIIVVSTVKGLSGFEKDGKATTSKGTHWQSFDAGIAVQTFCLAAHEMGLGTVIMGIFDENKVAAEIGLPQEQEVSALIAIGYPAKIPKDPKRLEVSELLTVKK